MTDAELSEILEIDWPVVVKRAMRDGDAWARGFALSIKRQAKRPDWHPSPRQEFVMRRMVAEARARPGDEPGEVVE